MERGAGWAVECRGVTMAVGAGGMRTQVLRGIDLMVAAGEVTVLVGPSGCGKTTLISAITGMLTPTSGLITVFGNRVTALDRSALTRFRGHTVGFVFQQLNLLPGLTACENVSVPLLVRGEPARTASRAAADVLDRVGVGGHEEKYPSQLSGGQQQRVAIARALIHDPMLIVCDEPTAALDADAGQTVMGLLRSAANERGRAVIVVTHDERILRQGGTVARMADGRIVGTELPLAQGLA